jgi:hypothetical protein
VPEFSFSNPEKTELRHLSAQQYLPSNMLAPTQ